MINLIKHPKSQIQLYLVYSSIIISLMKAANEVDRQQFQQKLQFQSNTTVLGEVQPLPLYKLAIRPYDYYIQYSFQAEIARLNFYQELESFSNLIIAVQHITVSEISQSYFERWFGFGEKSKFSITCFMKYYNYTIKNWMDHQKGCSSVISEEEILMVLKQLLTFHKNYQENYHQPCGIFKGQLIYITPEKCLRIYPHSIKYNGQISVHKDQHSYLNLSMAKIDKQISVETTVSNSRTHIELTHDTESDDNNIHPDIRDIFLLVLQLISLKKYEHFYSQKHSMIIWDAVTSQLNSINVSHLSQEFLDLLKGCALAKNVEAYSLLIQVERLISMKQRMCKTIHIEKNQQLAELVLKRLQTEKSKNLQDLKFLAKDETEQKMVRRFRSY